MNITCQNFSVYIEHTMHYNATSPPLAAAIIFFCFYNRARGGALLVVVNLWKSNAHVIASFGLDVGWA